MASRCNVQGYFDIMNLLPSTELIIRGINFYAVKGDLCFFQRLNRDPGLPDCFIRMKNIFEMTLYPARRFGLQFEFIVVFYPLSSGTIDKKNDIGRFYIKQDS